MPPYASAQATAVARNRSLDRIKNVIGGRGSPQATALAQSSNGRARLDIAIRGARARRNHSIVVGCARTFKHSRAAFARAESPNAEPARFRSAPNHSALVVGLPRSGGARPPRACPLARTAASAPAERKLVNRGQGGQNGEVTTLGALPRLSRGAAPILSAPFNGSGSPRGPVWPRGSGIGALGRRDRRRV